MDVSGICRGKEMSQVGRRWRRGGGEISSRLYTMPWSLVLAINLHSCNGDFTIEVNYTALLIFMGG